MGALCPRVCLKETFRSALLSDSLSDRWPVCPSTVLPKPGMLLRCESALSLQSSVSALVSIFIGNRSACTKEFIPRIRMHPDTGGPWEWRMEEETLSHWSTDSTPLTMSGLPWSWWPTGLGFCCSGSGDHLEPIYHPPQKYHLVSQLCDETN